MDIAQCKELLHQHATLRMPRFGKDDSTTTKVGALEDYLGEVAAARGDLEEARLWTDHVRHTIEDEWGRVEGWQQHVAQPNKATGPQIAEAKRKIKPDLYDAIRESKWVASKLSDQIRRLEKDEEVASRRYTLIVGG
jgi:hypothetical protein